MLYYLKDALYTFKKHLPAIMLLSVPGLLSLFIIYLLPAPTYIALGSAFLRTGSIGNLTSADSALIILFYLVSLFIISDVVVNINIVIKEEKTLTKIKESIIEGFGRYAIWVFLIYSVLILFSLLVQLITIDLPYHSFLYPLFTLFASVLLFFVPPAIVIDDLSPIRAISESVKMLSRKLHLLVLWIGTAFIALSAVELMLFAILPSSISPIVILLVNSLLLFPYLIVLQSHLYMAKYPLSP
ncbi:MAG: hypothetical protein QW035_00015 [Candidatus Anstonellales archaeon]